MLHRNQGAGGPQIAKASDTARGAGSWSTSPRRGSRSKSSTHNGTQTCGLVGWDAAVPEYILYNKIQTALIASTLDRLVEMPCASNTRHFGPEVAAVPSIDPGAGVSSGNHNPVVSATPAMSILRVGEQRVGEQ